MAQNLASPGEEQDAVPEAERRPILLRSYAEPPVRESRTKRSKNHEWVLVFDTETTKDERQSFRFGGFQLLQNGKIREQGLFYDRVTPSELEVLTIEARKHGCTLRDLYNFVHKIFFPAAYKAGALVVGFNLAFDLSRLALDYDRARLARPGRSKEEIAVGAPLKKADRFMAGGFTFRLSDFDDKPFLRIKHRNSRSSFFNFAKPAHQDTSRSQRRRGEKVVFESGSFLDVRTLAAALTSTKHSLRSLAKSLDVQDKGDFKDFSRPIDPEFIEYALNDVEVTRQCFDKLMQRYKQHKLHLTSAHNIHSEAGLGKAYLEQMSIKPWRDVQKECDPSLIGIIMSSYFGGRAEVHIRRTIVPTIYCDFASMYPTVCTLMGLWRFVIAQGVEESIATSETQSFLDRVQLVDLAAPETWKNLTTLVQVLPEKDTFPVRARYAPSIKSERKSGDMPTIGVNYLSSDRPLWFTLTDCVVSKLLTGKAPKVLKAVRFSAKEPQPGLKPIEIVGKSTFRVEPLQDDFYKRVIELRRQTKDELKAAEREDKKSQKTKNLDMEQLALKILANATSYGIFIELNVEDTDEQDRTFSIFTSQGRRTVESARREQPGKFFYPLLGTLITGAARLMLALTERLALQHGLDWAFCDTDSMAFANTTELPFSEFANRVEKICDWFKPLNPYEVDPQKGAISILEIEDQNFVEEEGRKKLEPLFCFAISAKRYVLFNKDAEGKPVIRKASAHGLGHFVAPYGGKDGQDDEDTKGVSLWQEDVWKQIIEAASKGQLQVVNYAFRPEMNEPARSQYAATRPSVLDWFKRYNKDRPYAEAIKPFNFLLSFFMRHQEELTTSDPTVKWDSSFDAIRPVAPFESNLIKAIPRIFDRNSDRLNPVPASWLRAVADVLRDYHRQPEYKFLGGGWNEVGILRRRHVFAERIEDIGKESDGWEADEARAEDQDTILTYSSSDFDRSRMVELITSVGKRELKREAKIAIRTIDAVHNDPQSVSDRDLQRLSMSAQRITEKRRVYLKEEAEAVAWMKIRADEIGLAELARLLELDPAKSNLGKVISGKRKPSAELVEKTKKHR